MSRPHRAARGCPRAPYAAAAAALGTPTGSERRRTRSCAQAGGPCRGGRREASRQFAAANAAQSRFVTFDCV